MEEQNSDSKGFSRICESYRQRNYRRGEDEDDSNDSGREDLCPEDEEETDGAMDFEESQDTVFSPETASNATIDSEPQENETPAAAQSTENLDSIDRAESSADAADEDLPSVLTKPMPKHKWNVIKQLSNRNLGLSCQYSFENTFNARCYGSLRFVQRLALAYKMDLHNGCVNALHFNPSGTRLASGSDDLNIIIWDWSKNEAVLKYDSGHRGNVFQAKFLPLCGDMHIVSCARDGHIRLAELTSGGAFHSTRRLGLHRGPAHKLSLLNDTPHIFLSAGEDSVVLEVDVRQSKPNKLLTVKHSDRKVALYSISSHPIDSNEFCVGGRDQYVRIYDRRRVASESDTPLKKYCPRHLLDSSVRAHVTSAVYNFNGSELLASYNDEDIYLFSSQRSDVADVLHRYQGHRNNATVKGVNFYGPRSEFVVSGSDCGNIFFWDKETEAIVHCVAGDENGVVNCLEPHPSIPVLATSGLDDDVKIWTPKKFDEPQLWDLKNTVKTNQREREEERRREPDTIDGEMLWILWRHIRRTERRRRMQQQHHQHRSGTENADRHPSVHLSSSSEESDESESEDSPRAPQCAPS